MIYHNWKEGNRQIIKEACLTTYILNYGCEHYSGHISPQWSQIDVHTLCRINIMDRTHFPGIQPLARRSQEPAPGKSDPRAGTFTIQWAG
jgi:hypothetical protein